ncbi:hypothetical protein [Flectobacillus sp. BAB-3569]|uniref:hypothetical protein n=1 Tax=Flectobacillus sp. BAB-3569 TaxID=1509483 RepID=UPI000BA2F03C|nr:hypothetical protein [Flectobacillus sp. BAB-3569]PAC27785.1 hypothetical protein BWI92_21470 [Flectobacillus sp. BAB-3569]
MGYRIRVSGTISNSNLGKSKLDKIANNGSILLVNFGNTEQKFSSVPTNNSKIRNLAWKQASKILNTGDENTLSLSVTNSLITGKSISEVTSKKGLHVIISQENDVENGNDLILNIPDLIANYMVTSGHKFLIEVWEKITRKPTTSITSDFLIKRQNSSNYFVSFERDSISGNKFQSTFAGNVLGNRRSIVGLNGPTGSPSGTDNVFSFYKFGSAGPFGNFELNGASSKILYFMHIVDLDVAKNIGESAEQCYSRLDADSLSYYNSLFGEGGAYQNDIHTSV